MTRNAVKSRPIRSVLVVEDEPLVRMYVTGILEESGFEVIEAESGEEALAILSARNRVGAVVSDVDMPGNVNGFELARRLHDDCPRLGIILVSGVADPSGENLPTGVRFLSKPVWASTLLRLVRQVTDPREASL